MKHFQKCMCTFSITNAPLVLQIPKHLYNKRVCPTKNETKQGISYLEREREGVREREREREWWVGEQVSRQAFLGLVRF